MGKKLFLFLVFICLLGSGMGLSIIALAQQQDAPKASPAPVATPTPTPKATGSALTEKEVKEGQAYTAALTEAVQALNTSLDQARAVRGDADALTMGWKFVTISRNLAEAQNNYNAWFAAVQKAHDCEGCALQDGKLISAPKSVTK